MLQHGERLKVILGNSDHCDVQLIGKNGCITAHQLILSLNSLLLREILHKHEGKPVPHIIHLPDFTVECIQSLLNYLYNGTTFGNQIEISEYVSLADALQLNVLGNSQMFAVGPDEVFLSMSDGISGHTQQSNEDDYISRDSNEEDWQFCSIENVYSLANGVDVQEPNPELPINIPESTTYVSQSDPLDYESDIDSVFGKPLPVNYQDYPNIVGQVNHVKSEVDYTVAKSVSHHCRECEKSFRRGSILSKHIRDVHDRTAEYECPDCRRIILSKYEFRHHMASHGVILSYGISLRKFEKRSESTSVQQLANENLKILKNSSNFTCKTCSLSFGEKCALLAHEQRHYTKTGSCPSCPICRKVITNYDNLKHHLRIHTGEHQYRCQKCNLTFMYRKPYLNHQLSHGKPSAKTDVNNANKEQKGSTGKAESGNFVCNICLESFSEKCGLLAHKVRHFCKPGSKPSCPSCHKKISGYGNLKTHMRIHTGECKFKCQHCDKKFIRKREYVRHQKIHKKRPAANVSVKTNIPKNFSCNTCSQAFQEKCALLTHEQRHVTKRGHNPSCPICQKMIGFGSLKNHLRIHTKETLYNCEKCGKKFIRRTLYLRHNCSSTMVQVKAVKKLPSVGRTNLSKFQCSTCSETFNEKCGLLAHKQRHRTKSGEGPVCPICQMVISNFTNLKNHLRKHTKETRFSCVPCNLKFLYKKQLVRHQKTHRKGTGLKKPNITVKNLAKTKIFACKKCNKTFVKEYYYKNHLYCHSSDKEHKCPKCSVEYAKHYMLVVHMTKDHPSYRPFSCAQCALKFCTRQMRDAHVVSHKNHMSQKKIPVNHKKCQCKICGRSFLNIQGLTSHIRVCRSSTSNGELKCKVCAKTFMTKSHYDSHCLTHTFKNAVIKDQAPSNEMAVSNSINGTMFPCTLCEKSFTKNGNLSNHMFYAHGKNV